MPLTIPRGGKQDTRVLPRRWVLVGHEVVAALLPGEVQATLEIDGPHVISSLLTL